MQNKEISTYLSKSLFIRGLQCHKSLYLHKYHPELRDEISEEKEALFQTGFEVGKFAQQLFYPMYFLDFETFITAIPLFDGIRPYRQVPFQYSLHIQNSEGAELKHFEYLAEPRKDPRRELIIRLLEAIPEKSCIITYTDFEANRLRECAVSSIRWQW